MSKETRKPISEYGFINDAVISKLYEIETIIKRDLWALRKRLGEEHPTLEGPGYTEPVEDLENLGIMATSCMRTEEARLLLSKVYHSEPARKAAL